MVDAGQCCMKVYGGDWQVWEQPGHLGMPFCVWPEATIEMSDGHTLRVVRNRTEAHLICRQSVMGSYYRVVAGGQLLPPVRPRVVSFRLS